MRSTKVALEAMQLQNGYARAVDTRDWDTFRTLFTPDVVAAYPRGLHFEGMEQWLEFFVPFHDECRWTIHAMSTHVVGEDEGGVWASCYGHVQWIHGDNPGGVNHATVVFRDRLSVDDGAWRIAARRCDLIMARPNVPIAERQAFPATIADLADTSWGALAQHDADGQD